MTCERCHLDLPPGASHANADACVASLQDALARALPVCRLCREPVPVLLCPEHAAVAWAKAKAAEGAGYILPTLLDWLRTPPGRREEEEGWKKWPT